MYEAIKCFISQSTSINNTYQKIHRIKKRILIFYLHPQWAEKNCVRERNLNKKYFQFNWKFKFNSDSKLIISIKTTHHLTLLFNGQTSIIIHWKLQVLRSICIMQPHLQWNFIIPPPHTHIERKYSKATN